MDYLMSWLSENAPKGAEYTKTTIVHGDFRLDNCVFHPTEVRIIAVLDWELSTLGNPYADLGTTAAIYHQPVGNRLPGLGNFDKGFSGIPTEHKMRLMYETKMGMKEEISEAMWSYALTFAMFKMAAICQGVYKRAIQGNASSKNASDFLKVTKGCAMIAAGLSK